LEANVSEKFIEEGLLLHSKLGEGASAVVFAAEAFPGSRFGEHGKRLAVKVFRHPPTGKSATRFGRELKIGMSLSSPHLVRYLGLGTLADPLGERPYIVMSLVEGAPLKSCIMQLSDDPASADSRFREIVIGALTGLSVLHQANIIHRDVQPSNVVVTPDLRPVFLDFGTAKFFDNLDLTSVWEEVGTRRFWAPECLQPETTRWWPSTDVFMLGSCLLYCLTGQYLFHECKNYPSFYRELAQKGTEVPSEFQFLPTWFSEESRFVLELMLNGSVSGRPSADTLMKIAGGTIPNLVVPVTEHAGLTATTQQLFVLAASSQVDAQDVRELADLLTAAPDALTTAEIEAVCKRTEKFEQVNLIGVLIDNQLLKPEGDWFDSLGSQQWLWPGARFSVSEDARRLASKLRTSPQWQQRNFDQFRKVAANTALSGTEHLRLVCSSERHYLAKVRHDYDQRANKNDVVMAMLRDLGADAVLQGVAADEALPRS
jgi:serine/threonine protein kinase